MTPSVDEWTFHYQPPCWTPTTPTRTISSLLSSEECCYRGLRDAIEAVIRLSETTEAGLDEQNPCLNNADSHPAAPRRQRPDGCAADGPYKPLYAVVHVVPAAEANARRHGSGQPSMRLAHGAWPPLFSIRRRGRKRPRWRAADLVVVPCRPQIVDLETVPTTILSRPWSLTSRGGAPGGLSSPTRTVLPA